MPKRPSLPHPDRRRSTPRFGLHLAANLRPPVDDSAREEPQPSDDPMIVDLSQHGCRLAGLARPLLVGAPITIAPAGQPTLTAWVRWCVGGEAGLEFARPLPAGLAETMQDRHPVTFPNLAA
ncbi:PilZ domain-containing protein [Novosphingobium cyanobacteriorum]|uniref:PilZ domain-containing protein n=1 Tax=Novosphingobium cyanobacteriorum TaxID=3024215 RepID=A0ABT6CHH7_9SPHN|nr:PilZ domain-containing protein [Novosphingobium cyanobacteriorum]MDF8333385.1 PilZ domain-containing protein [Novosphingobium cyanobacteriorum]